MRFYDNNQLLTRLGGTWTASTGIPQFAFDEDDTTYWQSSGQTTTTATLSRTIPIASPIDTIVIRSTNINAFTLTTTPSLISPVTNVSANYSMYNTTCRTYVITTNTINLTSLVLSMSNTLVANQDKIVTDIYAFKTLGRIKFPQDINPTHNRIQKVNKLSTGKVDVLNKGEYYDFTLGFKAYYNKDDNAIIQTLEQRQNSFWMWINDGDEAVMTMKTAPYRYQDFYKVAVVSNNTMQYYKNLYQSGLDFNLKLSQVV